MAVMLLEWVFTSVFLILVVLAIRAALGRRMGAGLRYALWAVVLVRLLVPVQLFTSPIAGVWVMTERRTEETVYTPVSPPAAPAYPGADSVPNLDGQGGPAFSTFPEAPRVPAVPDAPEPPAAPDLTKTPAWLGWAWLAGAVMAALVLLTSNLRFYWRLRRERVPLDGVDRPLRVYVAPGLPSPCLFGIVRPAVYVTPEAAASPDMLRHVLAHEYTHYRHGDHLWSLLRCGALAVHWWNPLVWLAALLSRRDGELACDEGALKRLGDGERAGYGNTLLALVTAKPRPGDLFRCATTMAGDKKSLKERISRIATAPKRILWAAAAAVLVTALACVCAFGQGTPESNDNGGADDLTADLSLSIDEDGLVEITGTIDGVTLKPGTYWQPTGAPSNTLVMPYAPFDDDDVDGYLYVRWVDDGHTALTLNTMMMPVPASASNTGFWQFEVDLSQEGGVVTDMAALASMPAETDSDTQLRLYPESISDEEAVRAARIAAKLMTAAEDYYNSNSDKNGGAAALPEGQWLDDPGMYVPEDVTRFVWETVQGRYDAYIDLLRKSPVSDDSIAFDGWRVESLKGPWRGTAAWDKDVEVWQVNYEFHTTTPEAAVNLVNGGAYLTEDGWLCPTYPSCTYVVFQGALTGERKLLLDFTDNSTSPEGSPSLFFEHLGGLLAEKGLADGLTPQTGDWEKHRVLLFINPDLNRDGVPETIATGTVDSGMGKIVGVWQGVDTRYYQAEWWKDADLLWTDEGYSAHAGYNAVFLCTVDGEDYLLRYHPTMYQGYCTYEYQLFTLSEHGEEQVVRQNRVEFDINFQPTLHQSFDPEAIAAFMDEVNGLLANSHQLINTDSDLRGGFGESGKLYDGLWWLDSFEGTFTRDPSKSLLENLRAFQRAMEKLMYAAPSVSPVDEPGTDIRLSYQDKSTRFEGGWEYWFQPEDTVRFLVRDLDGDGKEEIVFSLVWGHGTGCLVENLYAFDADTLEQYDTSGLNDMILGSIQSAGDGDNFYLSGLGMERVAIPKSTVTQDSPDTPVAEAISLGDIMFYEVGVDGTVRCRIGCDGSGKTLGYIGYLEVELEFTGEGFRCARCEYHEGDVYSD